MVYHCFTSARIWASLGKAGITRIAYNFRRDGTTDMRPVDDTAIVPQLSKCLKFEAVWGVLTDQMI